LQCSIYEEAAIAWLQRDNIRPHAQGIKWGM
jgi:hypothetical protein